ncbi:hypothetical protein Pcinc_012914 [Petrolisthes cinctipes]|uniref:Uncharacterized protein n=1 Tax=Petrolisthes cinctipes TaxID=88211 RepID=A0AAE1G065_PETCI|nr:hypothetical protein Pcinc_012914 [Petrolisthes cinctipes]
MDNINLLVEEILPRKFTSSTERSQFSEFFIRLSFVSSLLHHPPLPPPPSRSTFRHFGSTSIHLLPTLLHSIPYFRPSCSTIILLYPISLHHNPSLSPPSHSTIILHFPPHLTPSSFTFPPSHSTTILHFLPSHSTSIHFPPPSHSTSIHFPPHLTPPPYTFPHLTPHPSTSPPSHSRSIHFPPFSLHLNPLSPIPQSTITHTSLHLHPLPPLYLAPPSSFPRLAPPFSSFQSHSTSILHFPFLSVLFPKNPNISLHHQSLSASSSFPILLHHHHHISPSCYIIISPHPISLSFSRSITAYPPSPSSVATTAAILSPSSSTTLSSLQFQPSFSILLHLHLSINPCYHLQTLPSICNPLSQSLNHRHPQFPRPISPPLHPIT